MHFGRELENLGLSENCSFVYIPSGLLVRTILECDVNYFGHIYDTLVARF